MSRFALVVVFAAIGVGLGGLAVRFEAMARNPVRETARLHMPESQTKSLTAAQVAAIRAAVRGWRHGQGLSGPKPDGQLEAIGEHLLFYSRNHTPLTTNNVRRRLRSGRGRYRGRDSSFVPAHRGLRH